MFLDHGCCILTSLRVTDAARHMVVALKRINLILYYSIRLATTQITLIVGSLDVYIDRLFVEFEEALEMGTRVMVLIIYFINDGVLHPLAGMRVTAALLRNHLRATLLVLVLLLSLAGRLLLRMITSVDSIDLSLRELCSAHDYRLLVGLVQTDFHNGYAFSAILLLEVHVGYF